MKCPECKKDVIVYPRHEYTTLMTSNVFIDEQNRYHIHDPNQRTVSYECTNGHKWSESYYDKCLICGWSNNSPIKYQLTFWDKVGKFFSWLTSTI